MFAVSVRMEFFLQVFGHVFNSLRVNAIVFGTESTNTYILNILK